ncbi:MAG: alpha/beta hydrolase [Bacteroidota bacterium]
MKKHNIVTCLIILAIIIISCNKKNISSSDQTDINMKNDSSQLAKKVHQDSSSGYAPIGEMNMYYEIHGSGNPLVLIHGGGSTIKTTFGNVLHHFAKNHKVIAVELQGHGHTADVNRDESFEQDADDVAALLNYLKINNADIFGFSNGANTAMQIAIRHPEMVRKLVLASGFYKREGMHPQFWEFMKHGSLKDMPQSLQDAYKKVAPHPENLNVMCERDRKRMDTFKDWNENDIRSIVAPAFVIAGDNDVMLPEHTVKMYRLFPHAKLAIFPGGHGDYIGTMEAKYNEELIKFTVSGIEQFLNEPMPEK